MSGWQYDPDPEYSDNENRWTVAALLALAAFLGWAVVLSAWRAIG